MLFGLQKKSVKEFLKFVCVGFTGTILHLAVLYIFTEFFGIYYLVSSVFGFCFGVTNNFILNKIWTFKEKLNHGVFKKYYKYFVLNVIILFINLFILYFLTEFLQMYYILSQIIAVGFSFLINFFISKFWIFKK
ncbi:GtrA family protein [Candidatus Pacearchaeota archaeon]|nr:GtrA family protein [Candidatus Pacearchaeota archaeon]